MNSRDNVDVEENSSAQAAFARAGEEFKEQAAEGLGGKILKQYERDFRGHYARHAHAMLK